FDVEWKERESATNDRWTYEVKTYEAFEEIEDVEEVVEETEAALIISRVKKIVVDDHSVQIDTLTTEIKQDVVVQQTQEKVVLVDEEVKSRHDTVKEVIVTKETGVISQPAVSEKSSWFRRAINSAEAAAHGAGALVVGAGAVAVGVTAGAAYGAGQAASGALHKVDGVWKRTVQVLTTRKAHVDHVCPIAKTSY
ncbi:hypothetical protein BGZ70_006345, partial [Mortierella alpina]